MSTLTRSGNLDRLQQLYDAGFQDAFLDTALRKIVHHQIARDEADLNQVEDALFQFEQQYGLASDEFWRQYQAGQLPDTADYMEWSVLCKMRQRLSSRLRILRGDDAQQ